MTFYTKLAGVTYDGRQTIIRNLYRTGALDVGTEVILQREPNNPYDSFAVAVLTQDGQSIGYIPKDTARQISINMNSGMVYRAYVSAVTGGDVGCAYGVNLSIEYEKSTTENNITFDDTKKSSTVYTQYSETKANRVYNLFIKALDNQTDFKYSKDPDHLFISILQLGVDAPQNYINLFVQVREFDVIVLGAYDNFNIPTANLIDAFELIARINSEYIYPQLIFDFKDYNLYCRYRVIFSDELLQEGFVVETILNVGLHLERCGKAIMAVSLGLQTPEEGFKSIQND